MSLSIGSKLGAYEVVSSLGVGGMGEVYRARDTQLNRSVAIKVLPDAFAADPDRVSRFTREAQLLASLNHPNIAAIDPDTAQNVYVLDASGKQPPQLVASSPVRENAGAISSDGKWMLYSSQESGRFEVYAQAFPVPGRRVTISQEGGVAGWWSADDRQIVYWGVDLRGLWRVDVTPGKDALVVGTPKKFATLPSDLVSLDAMPDLKRFIGIAPARTGIGSVTVVRNWRAGIK